MNAPLFAKLKMKHAKLRISEILIFQDFEIAELYLSTLEIFFAIWLLNPFFDTFADNPSLWHGLHSIAPESTWGILCLLFGFLRLDALINEKLWLRKHLAFIGFTFWLAVAILINLAKIQSVAAILFSLTAMLSAFLYLRLVRLRRA